MLFCKKGFHTNFAKFTRKTKKEIPAQLLSCKFCEISHMSFKEPSGRRFQHKHPFCLLSHHDLSTSQKRCHTYFLGEYFFALICRLGTIASSIFPALRQKPIFCRLERLLWSFLQKQLTA